MPPKKFIEQYPQAYANLVFNAKNRLTSHFDVWRTAKYLINKEYLNSNTAEKTKYGISLMEKIPEDRDCEGAGIPAHWCSCGSYVSISNKDPRAKKAGEILLNSINSYTSKFRDMCFEYSDFTVKEAKVKMPNNDILVVIEMKMAGASPQFRSSIQLRENQPVITAIERLDSYGDQSMCIKHRLGSDMVLIKLCVCKVWLEQNPPH